MSDWTTEWPKEPGFYWAYGWPWGNKNLGPAKVSLCELQKLGNGKLAYINQGHFFYPGQAVEMRFLKAEVPEPPRV